MDKPSAGWPHYITGNPTDWQQAAVSAATVYFCLAVRKMGEALWDTEVLWLSDESGESTKPTKPPAYKHTNININNHVAEKTITQALEIKQKPPPLNIAENLI